MTRTFSLRASEKGAAAVEFALALPVIILMIWGVLQLGIMFEANAGMQQALGEGARYATLYDTSETNDRPTDTEIKQKIQDSVFQPGTGTFTVADPVDGSGYKDLSVTYQMPTNFIFFAGPTISITKSKRVYVVT